MVVRILPNKLVSFSTVKRLATCDNEKFQLVAWAWYAKKKGKIYQAQIKTVFYFIKKLFGPVNHYQLPNEHILCNFFAFCQTPIAKSNQCQYNKLKKKKNAFISTEFELCH